MVTIATIAELALVVKGIMDFLRATFRRDSALGKGKITLRYFVQYQWWLVKLK